MAWQVLQHSQGSLDDVRHMGLQPGDGQLLHDHGDRGYPSNALRPLVGVAAVNQPWHQLVYDRWMAVICSNQDI